MEDTVYHKENQCLMLRYELDVLTVVIRYITTKCLHERLYIGNEILDQNIHE